MKFTSYFLLIALFSFNLPAQKDDINRAISLISVNRDSAYALISDVLTNPELNEYLTSTALVTRAYLKEETDISGALWDYLEALRLLDSSREKDESTRMEIYNNLGKIYKKFSNYELALIYYYLSLEISPKVYKKHIFYNIGNVQQKMNSSLEAIKSYRLALEFSDNDINQTAKINSMIGVVNYNIGNYTQAENYLHKVINQIGKIDTIHIARAYHRLGTNYLLKGDTSKALTSYENALVHKQGKNRFTTLIDLAEVYLSLKEYPKVIAFCDDAEQYLRNYSDEAFASKVYKYRADANYFLGRITLYKCEIDNYEAFTDRLNGLQKEIARKGEKEAVAAITRLHEEAVAKKVQQKQNIWIAGVASCFLFISGWLLLKAHQSRKKKRKVSSELDRLNQQYSPRL